MCAVVVELRPGQKYLVIGEDDLLIADDDVARDLVIAETVVGMACDRDLRDVGRVVQVDFENLRIIPVFVAVEIMVPDDGVFRRPRPEAGKLYPGDGEVPFLVREGVDVNVAGVDVGVAGAVARVRVPDAVAVRSHLENDAAILDDVLVAFALDDDALDFVIIHRRAEEPSVHGFQRVHDRVQLPHLDVLARGIVPHEEKRELVHALKIVKPPGVCLRAAVAE